MLNGCVVELITYSLIGAPNITANKCHTKIPINIAYNPLRILLNTYLYVNIALLFPILSIPDYYDSSLS